MLTPLSRHPLIPILCRLVLATLLHLPTFFSSLTSQKLPLVNSTLAITPSRKLRSHSETPSLIPLTLHHLLTPYLQVSAQDVAKVLLKYA